MVSKDVGDSTTALNKSLWLTRRRPEREVLVGVERGASQRFAAR